MKRLLEAKFTGFGHLFHVLIWGWGKREQNESQVSTRGHAINQKMQGMESRKPELSLRVEFANGFIWKPCMHHTETETYPDWSQLHQVQELVLLE